MATLTFRFHQCYEQQNGEYVVDDHVIMNIKEIHHVDHT